MHVPVAISPLVSIIASSFLFVYPRSIFQYSLFILIIVDGENKKVTVKYMFLVPLPPSRAVRYLTKAGVRLSMSGSVTALGFPHVAGSRGTN